MKNIILFTLFAVVLAGDLGAQGINFNTLPAITSITASSPFPTVTSGGRWRKATAAQMQAFIMPRPVTRVAPSNRYVLGYVSGSDSLQYIPGGLMSQLPETDVTINADTNDFSINTIEDVTFSTALWGSGWINRLSLNRSGSSTLSILKSGATYSFAADSLGLRMRTSVSSSLRGFEVKPDSLFITPETQDSIAVGEVLTVVGKIGGRAYIKTRSVSGSGLADGDKGDITVSSGGNTWTLDNNVVGSPQLASSGVTASTYALATIVVDQDGRITDASNGVLAASAILDFPSTTAGGTQDLTITVTGAIDGDPVSIGVPNACATVGTFFAWVSATNTVSIRFFNPSGGSVNPTSGTFKVKVIP
jgi:hypothetical protein